MLRVELNQGRISVWILSNTWFKWLIHENPHWPEQQITVSWHERALDWLLGDKATHKRAQNDDTNGNYILFLMEKKSVFILQHCKVINLHSEKNLFCTNISTLGKKYPSTAGCTSLKLCAFIFPLWMKWNNFYILVTAVCFSKFRAY